MNNTLLIKIVLILLCVVGMGLTGNAVIASDSNAAKDLPDTAAPLLWLPAMNVFRRHTAPAKDMFHFYGNVLGLKQLNTITDVGNGGVARFKFGNSEIKFTGREAGRNYVKGGVNNATGMRLISFFYPDQYELERRFKAADLPLPKFMDRNGRVSALVKDPDGQDVELVVVPKQAKEFYDQLEVGLTVSDLKASRDFYASFVGLEGLEPQYDALFEVTKYPYRNGSTIISLRQFGKLPADTGSGGVQYVVSDVATIDGMAKKRNLVIDKPLSQLGNYNVWTIWIDDPDGITNYFAQTPESARE